MSPRYRMGTGAEEARRAAFEAVDAMLDGLACIASLLPRPSEPRSGALADAASYAVSRARKALLRLRPPSRSAP